MEQQNILDNKNYTKTYSNMYIYEKRHINSIKHNIIVAKTSKNLKK